MGDIERRQVACHASESASINVNCQRSSAPKQLSEHLAVYHATKEIMPELPSLVIFMIWLYVSWLILLVGSTVAFYTQHPEYLGLLDKDLHVSARMRERIGLQAMVEIGRRHYFANPPFSAAALAERLRVPLHSR